MIRTDSRANGLILYAVACYALELMVCVTFSSWSSASEPLSQVFLSLVLLTYPAIYLLPVFILCFISSRHYVTSNPGLTRLTTWSIIVISTLTTILLYADLRLHDLFDFHVNGFVLNLLLTPGGVESMGGGTGTYIAVGGTILTISVLHVTAYYCSCFWQGRLIFTRANVRRGIFILLSLTLVERAAYGLSEIRQFAPILITADTLPLYNRVTFRSLCKALGIDAVDRSNIRMENNHQQLNYPETPLQFSQETKDKNPNIIWLVSESMRWDMLDAAIMPDTYERSASGLRFLNHYSGGNGTRQGLFSLFYGIYGSYWDSFLMARRQPVLMDVLQAKNYQLALYTSAQFTYPEFDQTLFADVPAESLHQKDDELSAYQQDIQNTNNLISFIRNRDKSRPFMVFMFYESTHARYDFPLDAPLKDSFLADLNYATMTRDSLKTHIDGLKNRYINASHFIDSQMERVFETLSEEGLWDESIVMATGDHGEEFMENGFWGHNSGFSEQQIRTPMVLWLPGQEPAVREDLSSHMDIVPTILPLMGVTNPAGDYSLGVDLTTGKNNSFVVVSDWAGVCYVGHGFKFTMPFGSSLALSNELFDNNDDPVANVVPFLASYRKDVTEILNNAKKYTF